MFNSHSSRSYPSGKLVPETGHYLVLHPSGALSYGKILFDKGETFPLCSRCDDVRYACLYPVPENLTLRKTEKRGQACTKETL